MIDGDPRGAYELAFLPGFDGEPDLRRAFIEALAAEAPVRPVRYPRYPLGTLDAYQRFAAGEAKGFLPLVLVAESFSGLVAARWAARDPRVAALVLCGAFARNPVGVIASFGAALPSLTKLGPRLTGAFARGPRDFVHRQWATGLEAALRGMRDEVVAERLRLITEADVRPDLAALTCPIVLVQYDGDHVINVRARRELESVCHNAAVVRIDGPHFAIETQPRACAEAIRARLRILFPLAQRSAT
jgi:pimeloyl-ACP methyl ester carboxylesterase